MRYDFFSLRRIDKLLCCSIKEFKHRKSARLKMLQPNEMELKFWLCFYTQFKLIKLNCSLSTNHRRLIDVCGVFLLILLHSMLRSLIFSVSLLLLFMDHAIVTFCTLSKDASNIEGCIYWAVTYVCRIYKQIYSMNDSKSVCEKKTYLTMREELLRSKLWWSTESMRGKKSSMRSWAALKIKKKLQIEVEETIGRPRESQKMIFLGEE